MLLEQINLYRSKKTTLGIMKVDFFQGIYLLKH